ncbi:hypothetical protein NL676_037244 [Syzygium grande]|nr:hypothetical protein NL676_037244 [Syzygium grande]
MEHASDIVGHGDGATQIIEETQIIAETEVTGETQIIEEAVTVLEERLVEKGVDQHSDVVQDTVTVTKTGDSVDSVSSMHAQDQIADQKVIGSDTDVQTEEGIKRDGVLMLESLQHMICVPKKLYASRQL